MPSYSEVQKAVRVEKFRVWFAWLAGTVLMLLVAQVVNVVTGVQPLAVGLFLVVFVLLTVTAYRMHAALNRRADRERRSVLGEDYPG
ncbi:hypothetical protein [Streptomyces sp. NPDC017086]|uniref:hypothetical protein n=1 Tax=Streptomyces sp. NPDC017086 TaxID=3364976 RepID=UPI0037AA0DE8